MSIEKPVSVFLLFIETMIREHSLTIACLICLIVALMALFWIYCRDKLHQQHLFHLTQERNYLQAIIESNRQGLFGLQNHVVMPDRVLPFWQRWGRFIRTKILVKIGAHWLFLQKGCDILDRGEESSTPESKMAANTGMTHFQGAITNGSFARMVGIAGTWSYSDTGIENGGYHLQGYERLRANLSVSHRQKLDLAVSQLCSDGVEFGLQVTLETPPRLLNISGYHLLCSSALEKVADTPLLGCALWVQDQSAQANQDFVRLEMVQARQEAVQLRAMLDALPFPVWRRDTHLDVTDANLAYKQMLETDLPLRRGPVTRTITWPIRSGWDPDCQTSLGTSIRVNRGSCD